MTEALLKYPGKIKGLTTILEMERGVPSTHFPDSLN